MRRTIIGNKIRSYAASKKVVTRDFMSGTETTSFFSKYTKEEINNYLKTPDKNEKELRNMSIYLYNISLQYKAIINYFSSMATFAHIISPTAIDTSKKVNEKNILSQYNKVKTYVHNMNIAHEFSQVITIMMREDVFYGYIWSTPDSWTLQRLDPTYCSLSGEVDGCWVFGFDFQYFNGKEVLLDFYPAEFKTKYAGFKRDAKLRWQDLEPKNIICMKANEDLTYCLPPFVGLFSDIANVQDYKDLAIASSEMDNYKLLNAEIGFDKDGNPLIDAKLAKEYYEQIDSQLPDAIGLSMSPFKIVDYRFDKNPSLNGGDDVQKAEEAVFRGGAVSSIVFGGGKNPSAAAVKISVTVNETVIFKILRQLERNINRLLKDFSGTQKFNVTMLDVTYYNKQEVLDSLLKVGTYGQPLRSAINAVVGVSQSNMEGMLFLENTLLKLQEQERPLTSSNTQSGAPLDEGGKPTNASKGKALDSAGEQTQENDSNANRDSGTFGMFNISDYENEEDIDNDE